jgi:opacity protein-like surface antigen
MKKHLSLVGALLTTGMLTTPVYAATHYYVSGNVGVSSFSNIKIKTASTGVLEGTAATTPGIDLMGAAGRSFGNFRLEGEVGYQRNNSDTYTFSRGVFPLTGHFSVTSYMINSYYDIKAGAITPYLSAGLGLARVSLNKVPDPPVILNETQSALGYQFGVGIAVPVTKTIDIDARYRYSGTSTVTLNGSPAKLDISGSGILVGVRVGL